MGKHPTCKECKRELWSSKKSFIVSGYTNQVGYQKKFDNIEEASLEISKAIKEHDTVTFRKELEFVEE